MDDTQHVGFGQGWRYPSGRYLQHAAIHYPSVEVDSTVQYMYTVRKLQEMAGPAAAPLEGTGMYPYSTPTSYVISDNGLCALLENPYAAALTGYCSADTYDSLLPLIGRPRREAGRPSGDH